MMHDYELRLRRSNDKATRWLQHESLQFEHWWTSFPEQRCYGFTDDNLIQHLARPYRGGTFACWWHQNTFFETPRSQKNLKRQLSPKHYRMIPPSTLQTVTAAWQAWRMVCGQTIYHLLLFTDSVPLLNALYIGICLFSRGRVWECSASHWRPGSWKKR